MIKPSRVLLVEDDPSIRESLTNVLVAEDFQVIGAASSHEAIVKCSETHIDVVLLDLNLGGEDGWAVFQSLKRLRPSLPIIVTSGRGEHLAHCAAASASGVLEKPFDITVLLGLLNKLTASRQVAFPSANLLLKAAAMVLLSLCVPFAAPAQTPGITQPFNITGIRVQNSNAIVSWQGGGATNQLQHASSLTGPWQNIGLPTTGSSATNLLAG